MIDASVRIGQRNVGDGHPTWVVAEIGINHNGSVALAKKMVAAAARAGVDAVKFQKRTPELCVPREQWDLERDTPWGRITYMDYRHRVELDLDMFAEIDRFCRELGIAWFASCWDEPSVDFIERFDPPCHKIASACVTDLELLKKIRSTGRPVVLSTGMSTAHEIVTAVRTLGLDELCIAHSTSAYPCPAEELNLRMITTLKRLFPVCPIGYSGHESGLSPTLAAVALGATFVERHLTLDRAMWGTDQAASVEPHGFERLVAKIREVERSLGDGIKRVHESELGPRQKLRRVPSVPPATPGAQVIRLGTVVRGA